jgi:hypothetical protein
MLKGLCVAAKMERMMLYLDKIYRFKAYILTGKISLVLVGFVCNSLGRAASKPALFFYAVF